MMPKIFRRRFSLIILSLTTVALAACGGDSSSGNSTAAGASTTAITAAGSASQYLPIRRPGASPGLTESTLPLTTSGTATATTPATASPSTPTPTVVPAVVGFASTAYAISQANKLANVVVNRSGSAGTAVSVRYATFDGTGVAGALYTAVSGTLQWDANDVSSRTISVPVNTSASFSGVKSFTVGLSNPSADVELDNPNSATVTVTGNGTSSVQLSSGTYTAPVSAGAVTITATRSGTSSGAVSVAYATGNGTAIAGTNYTSTSGTLNWAANDTTAKTITIATNKSASTAGSTTFAVLLSAPTGGATLGSTAQATVTLTPKSTTPAAAFLAYAATLKSTGKLLVGQHTQYYEGNTNDETQAYTSVTPLYSQTGKLPAIIGVTANWYGTSDPYNSSGGGQPDLTVVKQIITDWYSASSNSHKPVTGAGVVQVNWGNVDPTGTSNGNFTPISSAALAELVTPGSGYYNQWVTNTQQLQTWLLSVVAANPDVVLMVRLFAELNGNWCWYGVENSQTDVQNQILLQQQTFTTLFSGGGASLRNNVLISYDANNYSAYNFSPQAAWPGTAYADVAGWDAYDSAWSSPVQPSTYTAFANFGVPLILCEVAVDEPGQSTPTAAPVYTVDNRLIPNFLRTLEPAVVGYVQWNDNGQAPNSSMSIAMQNYANDVMNDSSIVTLADLPAL